jgi:hypothetical protein
MDVASWATWGWIGLSCELVGIGIALWGVVELSKELFPGSPVLPLAGVRRFGRWFMRTLGIKPKPSHVRLEPAELKLSTGQVRPQATKPRPTIGAPRTEWNEYWDSRLGNLSEQIDWLRKDMKEANDSLAKRLKAESAERHTAITRLEERLKVVVGGEGGRGLVRTWWGLAITAVGALLQGLAQGLD